MEVGYTPRVQKSGGCNFYAEKMVSILKKFPR